ncbi:MAG TPA: energy transducer TonB [Pyrinomonadaceae bacterium]|jgi:TonB family protein|nr:energy transducer TonB [Pyrinomonadaceae bacterium]
MIDVSKQVIGRRYPTCLLLLLFAYASTVVGWTVKQYRVATVPEKTLRKFAKVVVMPNYPEDSRRKGSQGVAVALLNIDEEGTVKKVEILQAPDESIGNAVIKATQGWKFQPATEDSTGKAIRLSGKLTFYFKIVDKTAFVENPR